jgi:hypothetical protein
VNREPSVTKERLETPDPEHYPGEMVFLVGA